MFPEAASIESGIVAEGGNGWMPNVEAIAALSPISSSNGAVEETNSWRHCVTPVFRSR